MDKGKKKVGTIQVDCDGLWTILKFLGQEYELWPDIIFETAISKFIELFDEFNIKATFFINGRDTEIPQKKKMLLKLVKKGHEISNHGMDHRYFRELDFKEKKKEIIESTQVLEDLAGKKPVGFRAPGFDVDEETLNILEEEGYLYDSSVFPTFMIPILKIWQRLNGKRVKGYGKTAFSFAPIKPYKPSIEHIWRRGERDILEIPVSVMPIFKLPFHCSYALVNSSLFKFGFYLNKVRCLPINYLFHLSDLAEPIDDERIPENFRLNLPIEKRISIVKDILRMITQSYIIMSSESLYRNFKEVFSEKTDEN